MKLKKSWFLVLLMAVVSCGDDGEGSPHTFYFTVWDGEAPIVGGQTQKAGGASLKVYSSAQAWVDGAAPLKTMTVNSEGFIETFDKFEEGNVVFAESGANNNWPDFVKQPNLHPDINIPGVLGGSATVFNSFLSLFEGVSGKTFLITDVLVNGSSIFSSVSDCSKDNFVRLRKDAKLVYSEGANVCDGATATQEFLMTFSSSKNSATTTTINGTLLYEFFIIWEEVANRVYVKPDFSQVWFRVNDGNEVITIYTKQG